MPDHAVVLDLDGTLVDSVHHHVTAWHRALVAEGLDVPMVRIHAGIGMGGDRLVPWMLGGEVDDDVADRISSRHGELFRSVGDDLRPTPGARALLADLDARGIAYVVATSANADDRRVLLDALGRQDVEVVDSDDVATSKPAPDLLLSACAHLGVAPTDAVMVGDSPWDAHAAGRVSMPCVLVRSGGFGDAPLREGAPTRIVDAPRDLVAQL